MKKTLPLLILLVFINLCVLGCVLKKDKSNSSVRFSDIQKSLIYLAENLEQAKFEPIRVGWNFDYGFKDGWLLNKFEYSRSLITYKAFQAKLKYPIYVSGPHTEEKLNLKSKYSFGHYNPKFLVQLRKSALKLMSKKDFIANTKPSLEKYNILKFLSKHKDIYSITQEHSEDFNRIKSNYAKGIQDKTLPENAYRMILPEMLDDEDYWNWSETSYHFWIRRDIDNTKDIWIGLINDVLKAYDY